MSEHRFRELDQAWERSQEVTPRPDYRMSMQWRRIGDHLYALCGDTRQARNWRVLNAFLATRLRVTPKELNDRRN